MAKQEFKAKLSLAESANIAKGEIVCFDDIVKNPGDNYSSTSGEFTATIEANYTITWKIFAGENSVMETALMKNGRKSASLIAKAGLNSEADGVKTYSTTLDANDTICVKVTALKGNASDAHQWEFIVKWQNPKKEEDE